MCVACKIMHYFLEKNHGSSHAQIGGVPTEVFVNFCTTLQITGVPVIWQLVLRGNVLQNGCTVWRNTLESDKLLHVTLLSPDLSNKQKPLSSMAGTFLFGFTFMKSSLVLDSPAQEIFIMDAQVQIMEKHCCNHRQYCS